jgi:quaternary ammonium compound-resistance protein SugE
VPLARAAADPNGHCLCRLDGIGAVGTLVVGILLYGEPAGGIRLGSAGLIVLGIIGLKLAHG